jgi:hypothetical protein
LFGRPFIAFPQTGNYREKRLLINNLAGTMATIENLVPGDPEQQRPRRLSSIDASRADLYSGPTVLVPPKHLMATSDAFETARSIEMAKIHLEEIPSSEEASPRTGSPIIRPVTTSITDKYAFAFDIDGVLIRGGEPIPEAIEAMKALNGENQFGIKV